MAYEFFIVMKIFVILDNTSCGQVIEPGLSAEGNVIVSSACVYIPVKI